MLPNNCKIIIIYYYFVCQEWRTYMYYNTNILDQHTPPLNTGCDAHVSLHIEM